MRFGEKLYALRKSRGLSQEQVAERCSITRQSVSKWELGQGYPETEKLLVLSRVLDVDLDFLLRDEVVSPSTPTRPVMPNPYQPYLGKWVSLLLRDKGLGAIPLAALIAINDEYSVFEMRKKKRAGIRGAVKNVDIQTMSEARMSEKKLAALDSIDIFDLKNGDNPYQWFIGKKCSIKLKRNDISRAIFSGEVYVDWLTPIELVAVTNENMTALFKNKEMLIKTEDVLTVIEM